MPQSNKRQPAVAETMLSFAPAPTPIFTTNWKHSRPAVSSPLSSSPLRASSPTSPQNESSMSMRQTQSSPIRPPKFKYAARPSRPNALMRRLEDAQDKRRASFLRSVRDKSDEKIWQRRDIEGHFLRTSWIRDMDRLSHGAPEISEADLEDASSFQSESMTDDIEIDGLEEDDVMVDEDGDDAELEAMLSSYEQRQTPRAMFSSYQQPTTQEKLPLPALQPASPSLSDAEYDEIFDELLSVQDIDQVMQSRPDESFSIQDIDQVMQSRPYLTDQMDTE